MANPNFKRRNKCPACSNKEVNTVLSQSFSEPSLWEYIAHYYRGSIDKEDFIGAYFSISFCPCCKMYFVNDIPDDIFYRKIVSQNVRDGHTPSREFNADVIYFSKYALEVEKISILLDRKPNTISILEFGSGFGLWLLMAKAFGYRTAGIEILDNRINYAKKNNLTIYRSIGELGEEKFDFIYTNQVFEHISDPIMYLKPLVDRLSDEGLIEIGVPESLGIRESIVNYDGRPGKLIDPIGHINCFSNISLKALADIAGLTPLSPSYIRSKYLKAMVKNKDPKFIKDFILATHKQKKRNTVYFKKSRK